eukprot:CAMPEP_0194063308 /NCGR_PEP_ID=MMETSP0009_2-20130614/79982_1 /TAXON_ID=210454 /ORGANISM="Grammatophora oceanica, Strain CCMP 410" /LENGTH=331 /DNA_ID=CAMNT_0038715373 /DNA_START=345 /DNA_END=1340 /DNA_ORIENTATION=-
MTVSLDTLKKQNADTSNALIEHWAESPPFAKLAAYEGNLTTSRDQEDAEKLQKGIDFAKSKGVIDPDYVPEPYVKLDVLGQTPDAVASKIIQQVKSASAEGDDEAASKGSVIVLCGLSGTGKGTTVSKLREKLEGEEGKQVVTWSNGNIFRSVTYLAATWCEQNGCDGFDAEKALTKENLASYISMLSFGKFGEGEGEYDTRIHGLGLDMYVSKVQNTELKSPKVSKNIPTVAQVTQGEVILFAADAVKTLGDAGRVVLLEGREQTVNYVRTPHRFTLMLSDESLIGKRRAAQRLMAAALPALDDGATEEAVGEALEASLTKLVAEIDEQS